MGVEFHLRVVRVWYILLSWLSHVLGVCRTRASPAGLLYTQYLVETGQDGLLFVQG